MWSSMALSLCQAWNMVDNGGILCFGRILRVLVS